MTVIIYHNPRCSKSRQSLQLLKEHGVEPEVVEYLVDTPSVEQLQEILQLLNISPRNLMRKSEAEYKASGADDLSLNDAQLIEIMVAHPKLIERPIVVANRKAVIGRPPENVLEII